MENIDQLFEHLSHLQQDKQLPPVEHWQPERVGEIDIKIDAEGRWYHDQREIKRQPLVNLFATILRRDAEHYFLVTPVEKLRIRVADVPFMAIDMDVRSTAPDSDLMFTTNVGDYVLANQDHELTMRQGKPYLHVRAGLLARLTRNVFYRLVECAVEEQGAMCVYSQGARFSLGSL